MEERLPDTFGKLVIIALGILWLLFLSIVTYVEVDTRSTLRELQDDVRALRQDYVLVKTRQEYVLGELVLVKSSIKELERIQWQLRYKVLKEE